TRNSRPLIVRTTISSMSEKPEQRRISQSTLDAAPMHHHFALDNTLFTHTSAFTRELMRLSLRHLLPLAALITAGGCNSPRVQANVAQELSAAADEINGLKNDVANLQTQVDSLNATTARQDSLI